MSTPPKRSPAETWAAIRAMAEEDDPLWDDDEAADREAERILALSPEELRRELIEAGLDPDETRARADRLLEEVLATRDATLASEATPAPPSPGETTAPNTPSETTATPAAVAIQTAPAVPEPPPPAAPPVARAAPAKPSPARASRRAPAAVWLLAAAFAAVLVSSWHFAGETIARWIHPAPPEPSILPDTPSPSLVAEARAKKHAQELRAGAHAKCASNDWAGCSRDLDEAAKLDPAGDTESTVQADRAAAKAALENESHPIGPKK